MRLSRRKAGRRFALASTALAGAVSLAGCSSEDGGDWLSLFQAARSGWENRDAPVGLNEAAAIPYATLGVRIDDGREEILVLAVDTLGDRLWTSAARIAIATRNGRIVRTAGFGTDLSGYSAAAGNQEDWARPHSYSWSGDFTDLGDYSVAINCDVRPVGPEPITILGKQLDTVKVEENCRSNELDWSFTNSYWVSARTGRIWRSVQHIHPKGPMLEIELLRPPLSPG